MTGVDSFMHVIGSVSLGAKQCWLPMFIGDCWVADKGRKNKLA